jgi:hypothetical protein
MRLPNGHCPVCLSRIIESDIELHPSQADLAIQNFWCPKCERVVKSKTYSLKPKGEEDQK